MTQNQIKGAVLDNKGAFKELNKPLYWLLGLIGVIGLVMSIINGPAALMAIGLLAVGVLILAFPKTGFIVLIPALFLEANMFSIDLAFGRLRVFHIIIGLLFLRLIFDVLRKKISWKKTVLDLPLLAYLGINALAISVSPDKLVALKIFGLVGLLAMLYWLVVNHVRDSKKIKQIVAWFLGSSVAVALLGLWQVFSNWLASVHDIYIWNWASVHSDIIPFGRPYGTFIEPDWYGAIMMVALVLAGTFFLAKQYRKYQFAFLGLSVLFTTALALSAVRGAWLGLVVAAVALFVINRRKKILQLAILKPILAAILIAGVMFVLAAPELAASLVERALSLTKWSTVIYEARFEVMREGLNIWQLSPWLGHGPGGFNILGSIPNIPLLDEVIRGLVPFQTNVVINLLVDTGVAGLAIFVWLITRLVRLISGTIRKAKDHVHLVTLAGLTAVLVGMALTYQVTTGIWLALTWFLVGLTVATAYVVKEQS